MTVPFIKKEKHEIIEYFSHWEGTFTGNVKKYLDIKPLKIARGLRIGIFSFELDRKIPGSQNLRDSGFF